MKNLVPAAVLLVAWVVVALRARTARWVAPLVAAVSVGAWCLLFAYNERYFGALLGQAEPSLRITHTGLGYTLGLLLGRDHGLFVQVPFAVLGVLGLVLALRRTPVAVVATAAALVVLVDSTATTSATPTAAVRSRDDSCGPSSRLSSPGRPSSSGAGRTPSDR